MRSCQPPALPDLRCWHRPTPHPTTTIPLAQNRGTPFQWCAPHPAHDAWEFEHAIGLVHDATAAHAAASAAAANHPRSATKAAEAQKAAQDLEDAQAAEEEEAGALAAEVPQIIEESWYPLLVGLYWDTPFAAKIRRSVGAAAQLPLVARTACCWPRRRYPWPMRMACPPMRC